MDSAISTNELRASLMARASPMQGEETEDFLEDPRKISTAALSVKIQANHASLDMGFQEASVLQKISERLGFA